MIYGSVCSGIEAASVAWEPLGWRASFFSEIEKFPRAVLAARWPEVKCHGDFTTIQAGDYDPIDLLVGGTPCQDFSIAGLRAGITGDRGNLTLEFVRLAARLRPRWIVWENVPGILSDDGGRSFGSFLGGLGHIGYGFAYRVLDAQYAGLAQRRERVFVIGYLGDWRPPAAVLFERESLRWNPAPSRKKGEGIAPAVTSGATNGGTAHGARSGSAKEGLIVPHLVSAPHADISPAIKARDGKGASSDGDGDGDGAILVPMVAHALRADGFDASEDGTGRGTPLVPVAFNHQSGGDFRPSVSVGVANALQRSQGQAVAFTCKDSGADAGEVSPTLRAMGHAGSHANAGGQVAVAFDLRGREGGAMPESVGETSGSLRSASGGSTRSYVASSAVRRLTPLECARLQGFPDHYLDITYRGKPAADGPKYKALGNSFPVPIIRWIGERIDLIDGLIKNV
jgi:DNA (cytosine-5)-methyltransferase 1